MAVKKKSTEARDTVGNRENLYMYATFPDLEPYCKVSYNSESLSKIIIAKYPKHGYEIVQHFYDACSLNPLALA